jgi:hypothetical protein
LDLGFLSRFTSSCATTAGYYGFSLSGGGLDVEGRDFRIQIGQRGASGYEVSLRTPEGAEITATMQLPLATGELEALAGRIPDAVLASSVPVRRSITSDEHPVRQLGSMLFNALLAGSGSGIFAASRDQADRAGAQLRIVLQIRPPELGRLPWEFLYDSSEDDYVCLDTPLIRYPQVSAPVKPLQVTAPLRILCMAARPGDQEMLATAAEQRRLHETLSDLERDGRVELGWVAGGTWRDLRDAMRRGPWHVFHFSGHGGFDAATQEGALALADDDGSTFHLGADDLAMLLRRHPSLRLVLLNACEGGRAAALDPFSSVAGALMRRGVPAVLAMQYQISDKAALEFGRTFYENLAAQFPVELCVREARQAIRLALKGSLEWGTPVLYMRPADGVLFHLADAATIHSVTAATEGKPQPVRPKPAVHQDNDHEQTTTPPRGTTAASQRAKQRPPVRTVVKRLAASRADNKDAHGLISSVRTKWESSKSPEASASGSWRSAPHPAPAAGNATLLTTISAPAALHSVTFSPDGDRLAIGCDKHLVLVVDLTGRKQLKVRHGSWEQSVRDVTFDQSGRRIATAGDDCSARIWDAATGARLLKVMHDKAVLSVAFSRDGLMLATGSADAAARIWDAATGKRLLKVTLDNRVPSVAFSPDGRLLATASWDKTARIWDASTGDLRLEVSHRKEVMSVAFSPDGRLLATASWDKTARIWDASTGRPELEVSPDDQVWSVAFSPSGRMLTTGSHDATARIWDARTGDELFKGTHAAAVCCVAFSPDGRMLATGSLDATIQLWRLMGHGDD